MIDVEPMIESSFARLLPEPATVPNWDDVVRRAGVGRPGFRRRALPAAVVVAAVVAAIVSPLGGAIGGPIGDFSTWLRGDPGKPASEAAQRVAEKTWSEFPQGATLRELVTTSDDGVDYTLYGFRLHESLCLRVQATGAATGSSVSCAPLRELRTRVQPVLVLEVDQSFGTLPDAHQQVGPDRFTLPRASVSFGIVADGVKSVELRSDDATHDALVASNSFLAVVSRPPAGNRVRAVAAKLVDGSAAAIPFAEAPFDTNGGSASHGTLHGPSGVDRRLTGGTIAWLAHHEERGDAFPATKTPMLRDSQLVFGRVVHPDPQMPVGVGLSLTTISKPDPNGFLKAGTYICQSLVDGSALGSGCSPADEFFRRSPVNFGLMTRGGGDQYSYLFGTASDDVTHLRLYLGTGEVVDIPLTDNAFVTQISRAKYPFRLVGLDANGLIVANDVMQSENGPSGPAYHPKQGAQWQHVATAGGVALWSVPSAADGVCWKLRYPGGAGAGGCTPPTWNGALRNDVVPLRYQPNAPEPVLLVETKPAVTRVEIRYTSGATESVEPTDGFVLHAVPRARVVAGDLVEALTAYDRSGAELGTLKIPQPRR
jgi:hypothetical protein